MRKVDLDHDAWGALRFLVVRLDDAYEAVEPYALEGGHTAIYERFPFLYQKITALEYRAALLGDVLPVVRKIDVTAAMLLSRLSKGSSCALQKSCASYKKTSCLLHGYGVTSNRLSKKQRENLKPPLCYTYPHPFEEGSQEALSFSELLQALLEDRVPVIVTP